MTDIGRAPPLDDQRPERAHRGRPEKASLRSAKLAMAGRLAASVMHEINNPSQAIADLVHPIGKDADYPDRVRAHAVQIEEQPVRIQYIARQTLSSSGSSAKPNQRLWYPWSRLHRAITAYRWKKNILS